MAAAVTYELIWFAFSAYLFFLGEPGRCPFKVIKIILVLSSFFWSLKRCCSRQEDVLRYMGCVR